MSFSYFGLNKSLFNKNTYVAAVGTENDTGSENGYAVIRLEPKGNKFTGRQDMMVKGVVQNECNFQVSPTWNELGGLQGVVPSIPGLKWIAGAVEGIQKGSAFAPTLQAAGFAKRGTKFSTRKVYERSGYLQINPQMKIVNWDDSIIGSPLFASSILMNYCIPAEGEVSFQKFKDQLFAKFPGFSVLGAAIEKGVASGIEKAIVRIDKDYGSGTGDIIKSLLTFAGNGLGEIFDGYDDQFVLRNSPTPLRVTIGQYFQHDDMVMTGINIKFSKEQTRWGPLYATIDLSLSSRRVLFDTEYTGLQKSPNVFSDRVKLINKIPARDFPTGTAATNAGPDVFNSIG